MVYPYNTGYQQPQPFPQYPQPYPQSVPVQPSAPSQMQQVQPVQQIQNGGFVSVPNINTAFNYPVAPGNAVTFKDENAPYIYEKIQSFSQLERPVFKKYRLVEETAGAEQPTAPQSGNVNASQPQPVDLSGYVKTSDFEAFAAKYSGIPAAFEQLSQLVNKLQFDVDALGDKSTKKLVQKARKDAEEE